MGTDALQSALFVRDFFLSFYIYIDRVMGMILITYYLSTEEPSTSSSLLLPPPPPPLQGEGGGELLLPPRGRAHLPAHAVVRYFDFYHPAASTSVPALPRQRSYNAPQGPSKKRPREYRTTLKFTAGAPPRFEADPQGSMLRRDDRKTCSPPLG